MFDPFSPALYDWCIPLDGVLNAELCEALGLVVLVDVAVLPQQVPRERGGAPARRAHLPEKVGEVI